MSFNVKTILSIAGSDSSGGAGIQADIKTISALGGYAASVVTALTAQNTQGVQMIYPISSNFVYQQLESVFSDLSVRAVKIGMLHDEDIITVVSSALKKFKPSYVVLDPVMVSKSGHELLKPEMISVLKKKLFPEVSLITPNIFEAQKILNEKIETAEQQEASAVKMGKQFQTNVLVKGGHLQGDLASDVLYVLQENRCEWFHASRIETQNTHGTGCSFSSAIATELTKNRSLVDAVFHAKNYLTEALKSAKLLTFGQGVGPIDHFYCLREKNHVI
ncbi:MAG TPA: bifunctional hydroxymethylpyrimidine kinase/phosphomethylpyrimidine kinase [Gammaproteobacteria bacterium]|nr:bifunctional hydroxymethylpyrimidine kinase/phosphomethylpyrimidine kinase [Gammaproteobacteria bacterium]